MKSEKMLRANISGVLKLRRLSDKRSYWTLSEIYCQKWSVALVLSVESFLCSLLRKTRITVVSSISSKNYMYLSSVYFFDNQCGNVLDNLNKESQKIFASSGARL